jgi:hypothetical protein
VSAGVQIELQAVAGQFKVQMAEAVGAVQQLTDAVRQLATSAQGGVTPAFRQTAVATDTLYGQLRNLKTEAVQHQRVFGYFGQAMHGLGIASTATGAALVGVAAGLASGMWIMAAVEGVKLIVDHLRSAGKAADDLNKKDLEAFKKQVEGLEAATQGARDKLLELQGLDPKRVEAEARLAEMRRKLAALDRREAEAQAEMLESNARLRRAGLDPVPVKTYYAEQRKALEESIKLEQAALDRYGPAAAAVRGREAQKKTEKEVEAHSLFMLTKAAELTTGVARIEADLAIEIERIRQRTDELGAKRAAEEIALAEKVAREKIRLFLLSQEAKSTTRAPGSETEGVDLEGDAAFLAKDRIDQAAKAAHRLALAGSLAGDAFGSLGAIVGGQAGKVLGFFGDMIQKAVQLAIALAATAGPFGWLQALMVAGFVLGAIAGVPEFEAGTPFVPRTGLALLHRGERVVPADENAASSAAGSLTLNFNAPVDQRWWDREQRKILRTIRRAERDRRGVA